MRLSKTVGDLVYKYYYAGDKLMRMTVSDGTVMDFIYGSAGEPYAVKYNGTVYYYILNLQGDVVRIVNSAGTSFGVYKYDAWGNVLYQTASNLIRYNPLRYRGYVYDEETKFYYLSSRYYDPEIGRFINADGYISTGQGMLGNNMFAYCNNNSVNYCDPTGTLRVSRPEKDGLIIVDVTVRLNKGMREHEQQLGDYQAEHDFISTGLFFAEKVVDFGEWDLKSENGWGLDPNILYTYNNQALRYDDIGNIHYGYVGSVAFNAAILLVMAGAKQIDTDGTIKWERWNSNFDDPRDQWAVWYGIVLWNEENNLGIKNRFYAA